MFILSRLLKEVKNEFNRNKLDQYYSNPKMFWHIINEQANKNKKRFLSNTKISRMITGIKQVINYLNTFFSSIGRTLASLINADS